MKKLLALAMVALLAGSALGLEYGDLAGGIGMFFSSTEFTDPWTNTNTTAAPFNAYVVLIDCPIATVAGYELGITMDASIFALGVSGPNGWTNFGGNLNHLAGYQTPLAIGGNGAVVLATIQLLYGNTAAQNISFGPSDPSSWTNNPQGIVWNGPAIADGANFDLLYRCFLTGGVSDAVGVVATLHGDGVVATESRSWTGVKSLFD